MSMYIEWQKDSEWHLADTSDPEAREILSYATQTFVAEPLPADAIYGNYDEDIHLDRFSLSSKKVPLIRKYLVDKGQAYREGMGEMLTYIETSKEPVTFRVRD